VSRRPRIAVIGAGIGGLTVAAALRAAGAACDVYERTARLTETGAGLQLSPNAVRPLRRLGLRLPQAVPLEEQEVRSWTGSPISRTEFGVACERLFGAPYLAVHRGQLQSALLELVDRDRLHLGAALTALADEADGIRLTFADGRVRHADVVIGADGVHSVVRTRLVADRPVPSGMAVFRGLLPTDRLPYAPHAPIARMWLGPAGHVVCYPVAAGRLLAFAATAPAHVTDVRAAFGDWHGLAGALARAAGDVRRWPLQDREALATWTDGRVTVLGDAAHAMLPFLAQGANQTVEDAVDLAARLAGAEVDDLPGRLQAYQAARAPRANAIHFGARQHAAAVHLPDGPGQRARDAALRAGADLRLRVWLYGHRAGEAVTAGEELRV